MPPVVTRFFPQPLRLCAQEDRVVGFWAAEDEEEQLYAGPDDENVKGPSPGRVLVDEATN